LLLRTRDMRGQETDTRRNAKEHGSRWEGKIERKNHLGNTVDFPKERPLVTGMGSEMSFFYKREIKNDRVMGRR